MNNSTCLLCYQQSDYFVLPPCGHKHICWKCCLKLIQGSIFRCPFCQDVPTEKSIVLFVSENQMEKMSFKDIMKNGPFRSQRNSFYYYSNQQVAKFIEGEISFHCVICGEVHDNLNQLRKHLNLTHKKHFCEVCIENRKCIITEQVLYSQHELMTHNKMGQFSEFGEFILYHPYCEYCKKRFYDLDSFRFHLKISSHLKCEICSINYDRMKYVYYKDFTELEKHFKRSHWLCEKGDCISKQFENVFASRELMEEHIRRCHKRGKNDKQEKIQKNNFLFSFNKNQEETEMVFDGIGKNFEDQFKNLNKPQKIEKQDHKDDIIDIRQFYPEIIKMTQNIKLEQVIQKYHDLKGVYNPHDRKVNISFVWFFKPLEMSNLLRNQIERFLGKIYSMKICETIIDIFFARRAQYASPNEYFADIEKRMKGFCYYSYYLAFPQLIRYMKDENRYKKLMDKYYSDSLRQLTLNKVFLFHQEKCYGDILFMIKEEIEVAVSKKVINPDIYVKYVKEMNHLYYLEHQNEIFYVPKEKVINLYHMISRCKTKDFLKFNWLLKIGFSSQSYQNLTKNFLFQTKSQIDSKFFQQFNPKELSLLYLYAKVCTQAIFDNPTFMTNKKQGRPLFFSDILNTIESVPYVSGLKMKEILTAQNVSMKLQKQIRERTRKGIIVDDQDCPSLLIVDFDPPQPPYKTTSEQPVQIGIGHPRIMYRNQPPVVKKIVKKKEEEFPTLSNGNKIKKQVKQEDQFPVFNFNDKFVQSQKKDKKDNNFTENISFNNKTVKRNFNEEEIKVKLQNLMKQKKKQKIQKQSNKPEKQQHKQPQKKQEVIIIQKKNKIEEQNNYTFKKKNKPKPEKTQSPKEKQQELSLFEKIQKEADEIKKEKPKKIKPRIDQSSSEDQVKPSYIPIEISKKNQKNGNKNKTTLVTPTPAFNDDDFGTLLSVKKEQSIINKLISQSSKEEDKTNNIKIKKNKKKNIIIERFDLYGNKIG